MKTPKQLRADIQTLTQHLGQVRDALNGRSNERIAQIGKECRRTADSLTTLLKSQDLPENYKVAVVGRFKAGKSSFVNELLGAQLAGEDTSPETAAITTFRHGHQVKATIRFVPSESWVGLQRLHEEDPKHIDAHRVKMWKSFSKPRKTSSGEPGEAFDLPMLEVEFIKAGGRSVEISLAADGAKKSVNEFRRRLKEFTSGSRPHHCLVESIEITSPAAILDEGVLLIDTPGLDDTERFRVSLTEKAVEHVDAVLFLTKSGVAYGQSEKDFLLTLLRKGTVKQLIVVVTQVDQTYDQHLRSAQENDEDADSISLRIEKERVRITAEIAATLNDLSTDDSPSMQRYREQLGVIGLVFTSATMHRDWKAGKAVSHPIYETDPGGVERLKNQLLRLLSTESRLALTAQNISNGGKTALLDLQTVLQTKMLAIRSIKDREVAEQKLHTFRLQFGEASERFKGSVELQVGLLRDRLRVKQAQQGTFIENISLRAEQQLAHFEIDDVGRHWRTRRSGYWGYMRDFQVRVANGIFPKVQEMLGEHTELFAHFAKDFEVFLDRLSNDGAKISDDLELGSTMPFDVTVKLKESLERSLLRASELISGEELRVTSLLDDFVSEEVSERITLRRAKVTDIWGTGTTSYQSAEIRDFYREVKALLQQALTDHLKQRCQEFGHFLTIEAESAPRDALNEVQTLLEQAADNIRAAASALVAGQKDAAEALTQHINEETASVLAECDALLGIAVEPGHNSSLQELPASFLSENVNLAGDVKVKQLKPFSEEENEGWFIRIQRDAIVSVNRYHLNDGATGWPFERMFEPHFLKGALRVALIDPYLTAHHQIRNLNEFLLLVAENAKPKEIVVVTSFASAEVVGHQERAFDNSARDLFVNFGIVLTMKRETNIHDRFLVLDHGVLFKLGRGLDVYKPATGLAAHRQGSRKVRQTDIDVFVLADHPLLS